MLPAYVGSASPRRPSRHLRMGPIAARLLDRQGRRFREVFGGLQQPTIQTLVVQIGTGQLLSHPLDRLCAGLHYRLHVRIPATPRLSHAVRLSSAARRADRRLTQSRRVCPALSLDASNNQRKSLKKCAIERIESLNRKLTGWAHFYQYTDYTATLFSRVDRVVFWKLGYWLARRYRRGMPSLMRESIRSPEPGRAKTWVLKGQNSRGWYGEVALKRLVTSRKALPQLRIQRFSATFRDKHHMIFALLLRVA